MVCHWHRTWKLSWSWAGQSRSSRCVWGMWVCISMVSRLTWSLGCWNITRRILQRSQNLLFQAKTLPKRFWGMWVCISMVSRLTWSLGCWNITRRILQRSQNLLFQAQTLPKRFSILWCSMFLRQLIQPPWSTLTSSLWLTMAWEGMCLSHLQAESIPWMENKYLSWVPTTAFRQTPLLLQ